MVGTVGDSDLCCCAPYYSQLSRPIAWHGLIDLNNGTDEPSGFMSDTCTSVNTVDRKRMKQLNATPLNWINQGKTWQRDTAIAYTWPIDFLPHNKPVKRRHFVLALAGNRVCVCVWGGGGRGEGDNQQFILSLQLWNFIIFSLNHTQQKWSR